MPKKTVYIPYEDGTVVESTLLFEDEDLENEDEDDTDTLDL